MNNSYNETETKNVLATNEQQESASENEESDSITDQSSSLSENIQQQQQQKQRRQKRDTTTSAQQHQQQKHSTTTNRTHATQFSVQSSDTDGLRMKISAIRPTLANTTTAATTTATKTKQTTKKHITNSHNNNTCKITKRDDNKKGDKFNNNTNSATTTTISSANDNSTKFKASNKHQQQQHQKQKEQLNNHRQQSTKMPTIIDQNAASADASLKIKTNSTTTNTAVVTNAKISLLTSVDSPLALPSSTTTSTTTTPTTDATSSTAAPPSYLSDATESGLSEATTRNTASNEKTSKKIKVKRKKVQAKANSNIIANVAKNASKKTSPANKKPRIQAEFSSDSDDDLPLKTKQQKAPRLLLTAVSNNIKTHNNNLSQLRLQTTSSTTTTGTLTTTTPGHADNIGISSSDNELPDLVSAAIKRVESDTEDTNADRNFRKAATSKHLPLLQDFMEKTQMLGQTTTTRLDTNITTTSTTVNSVAADNRTTAVNAQQVVVATSSPQTNSVVSGTVRKRRGRPKKSITAVTAATAEINTAAINESGDSGVISTTSTMQSTTPSPKMQTLPTTPTSLSNQRRQQQQQSAMSPTDCAVNTVKPKIDIAYLDKRMYATERVLYPSPRNKRRPSTSAALAAAAAIAASQKKSTTSTKEELQLDPIWREIDVNKKFRVTDYKSDGGNTTTICSKVLAAKSGYVSDYGGVHHFHHSSSHQQQHNSGYKSDASCKSRYSTKSCMSRRSRAKSCGYRSDCKDSSSVAAHKSNKFRRKRRASMLLKSRDTKSVLGNLNDVQDILQLAGLSLGQSSEESNEYVCKPSLKSLPTTSASKKYNEIDRYVATGQYFGRGNCSATTAGTVGGGGGSSTTSNFSNLNEPMPDTFVAKMLLQRSKRTASNNEQQITSHNNHTARKIKSRRSSAASYCSSFYSGTSKVRRRHRRKSLCLSRGNTKALNIDSKLLTEIEIITSTFAARCRIQGERSPVTSGKEKLLAEGNKLQQTLTAAAAMAAAAAASAAPLNNSSSITNFGGGIGNGISAGATVVKTRDKRTLKKRKVSEQLVDFAMLSASAAAGGSNVGALTPNSGSGGTASKRRHKKASNSSSPDDHKLPLKKRHYLLTPGEKSSEAAAFAATAKLNAEAWAAAAAAAKSTASTKSQAQFNARTASATATASASTSATSTLVGGKSANGGGGLTPKKRHLMHTNTSDDSQASCSPLRIAVDNNSISGGKLLDISPSSLCSLKQQKRTRLECVLTKLSSNGLDGLHSHHSRQLDKKLSAVAAQHQQLQHHLINSPTSQSSCPPPGVFEPSVELEIQIPPIAKLSDTSTGIIAKAEVDSPLLALDINASAATKSEHITTRVVETLLHKTAGNLLLRRKRKKINRTGFPTVRRKKRKINDHFSLDIMPDMMDSEEILTTTRSRDTRNMYTEPEPSTAAHKLNCERVPQTGETSDTFVARANQRAPRLSVVSLERLQSSPRPATPASSSINSGSNTNSVKSKSKQVASTTVAANIKNSRLRKQKTEVPKPPTKPVKPKAVIKAVETTILTEQAPRKRGRKPQNPRALTAAVADPTKTPIDSTKTVTKPEATSTPISTTTAATVATTVAKSTAKPKKVSNNVNVIDTTTTNNKKTKKSSTQLSLITSKILDTTVKLPAGLDPNTNFRCKIRLKRRHTMHPIAIKPTPHSPSLPTVDNTKETPTTPEAIAVESAAKWFENIELEHDILPLSEAQLESIETIALNGGPNDCSANTNITNGVSNSDEKSATSNTNNIRKITARNKKNYLQAGLFSNYFKELQQSPAQKLTARKAANLSITDKRMSIDEKQFATKLTTDNGEASAGINHTVNHSLLPPPPYCEKYFRRTHSDFELPYDIWWAYKHAKLPARHNVPSWNYRKIRTNVYAESVRPNMAGIDHPTCNCKSDAACGDNCLNRMVYTECSPSNCPTRDKCRNQKIQRHEVAPGVERFMTENKGWGVRTKLPIEKGTYILEYVGEVVNEREFKDRMGTIYLNDTHHYCLHLDGGLVIDGQRMGSDGRFVNHSCEPNCEMQKWSVNGLSRMALFAKRNIEACEELTYDYNFSLFNPSEGQPCRCNTPQCRGVIGGKSQRVKPLPVDVKPTETVPKDARKVGRQRKHKARKNTQRIDKVKDIVVARVQQLSEKERKLVQQYGIFLVRNFEKIRCWKAKQKLKHKTNDSKSNTPTPTLNITNTVASGAASPVNQSLITTRRPSTPSTTSLAAQISALCGNTSRNIKTRGLTYAVQDPEVDKMAKMAVVLRDICTTLEALKSADDENVSLISLVSTATVTASSSQTPTLSAALGSNNKKKKAAKVTQKQIPIQLKTIKNNIEQGNYKQPNQFDDDMEKLFASAKLLHSLDSPKLDALNTLMKTYAAKKYDNYDQLLDIIGEEAMLGSFQQPSTAISKQLDNTAGNSTPLSSTNVDNDYDVERKVPHTYTPISADVSASIIADAAVAAANSTNEDVIRCICGLYKDEGLMIQCANCMVWQHTECTKADINADNYQCERCEPRVVDREIPLQDFTEEGHRYYLTLMRGDGLQVRQGDAVYVLRDIPVKDGEGKVVPSKKHTYETIGEIDYQECDIFRVERLWKNDKGNRFIFGHHFLRPHETFHEPSRRFYPNEVVRVPLYEVVPIELVIGRCWVLDRTTFCKGRPIECIDEEEHCFICELRVDKTARFFSKAKVNYPLCTKHYAFKKFPEKLKISKTYAPHDVDPSMLKTKKQKTENEVAANVTNGVAPGQTTISNAGIASSSAVRQLLNKTPQQPTTPRKRQESNSPANIQQQRIIQPVMPTVQMIKQRRSRLETVLKTMKLNLKNTQNIQESTPIDLSYLLSGRGARQKKSK